MALVIDFSVIIALLVGIWQFRLPRSARIGNLVAAGALFAAFVLVLYRHGVVDLGTVVASLLAGSIIGYGVARTVNMIQVPSMVALQHGAGGVAAFLVSFVELTREAGTLDLVSTISGVLGLTIGSLTFSGSLVASAKLANKMRQTPQILPAHQILLFINLVALLVVGVLTFHVSRDVSRDLYLVQITLSATFGILFSVRIGGADMPVLISFLNATAGLAAALCGMVIGNQLLIAFGATVAASGSILTHVMCRAMNRRILRVIWPSFNGNNAMLQTDTTASPDVSHNRPDETAVGVSGNIKDFSFAINAIKAAEKVIIIPGYGMALAKAQQNVAKLAGELVSMGKEVKYAIHPVAGRMPGHMNVLLAEVGVDYDMLVEMENINSDFPATDLAVVIGACDVVNPAAIDVDGTPISGMPILMAHEAKNVICCNFDEKPGYSGVENPLYRKSNAILLFGDAKETTRQLLASLTDEGHKDANPLKFEVSTFDMAANVLAKAERVIIVPGYGMALAKAQFKVAQLAAFLKKKGAYIKYAIHPVAGRMPGHMNVILAEAEVDYDDLLEMDQVNPMFSETDVALIIGACDVVNPAAMEQEGTPITGMPILMAHEAAKLIVCNFDREPGYSGVPNPIYENSKAILILGDAKHSTDAIMSTLKSMAA